MNAEKRRHHHICALQASQIAYGHLKASEGAHGHEPSLKSAMIYLNKALDACRALTEGNDNPLDPSTMTKANEQDTGPRT